MRRGLINSRESLMHGGGGGGEEGGGGGGGGGNGITLIINKLLCQLYACIW